MSTLAEFLLARIAEDEAASSKGGRHNAPGAFANDNYGCLLVDPARVLAECEAKRQIVNHLADAERGVARAARLVEREGNGSRDAQEQEFAADAKLDAVKCIAKHVAAVYANHPDYDEDWQPP